MIGRWRCAGRPSTLLEEMGDGVSCCEVVMMMGFANDDDVEETLEVCSFLIFDKIEFFLTGLEPIFSTAASSPSFIWGLI